MRLRSGLLAVVLLIAASPRPGWLGIGFSYETGNARNGRVEHWLLVHHVAPGSPADKSSLRANDLITAVNGKPLEFPTPLAAITYFESIHAGDAITFTVVHGRVARNVRLIAVDLPPESRALRDSNRRLAQRP